MNGVWIIFKIYKQMFTKKENSYMYEIFKQKTNQALAVIGVEYNILKMFSLLFIYQFLFC